MLASLTFYWLLMDSFMWHEWHSVRWKRKWIEIYTNNQNARNWTNRWTLPQVRNTHLYKMVTLKCNFILRYALKQYTDLAPTLKMNKTHAHRLQYKHVSEKQRENKNHNFLVPISFFFPFCQHRICENYKTYVKYQCF